MSLPELPEPYYTNGGAYDSWAPFDDLWSAEQMRAFYAEGVRAGMERAAVICEGFATDADNIVTAGAWDNAINTCAEAIRASAKSGGRV